LDKITGMPTGTRHVGLRASAFLSVLAFSGALKTHGEKGKIKALYVTSSFPKDTMPIDVMVEHQLKILGGPSVELTAVVFDNQPPWLTSSDPSAWPETFEMQRRGLRKLQEGKASKKLPRVTVKGMDYADIDDAAFLAPFFSVNFTGGTGAELAQKSLMQIYGNESEHSRQQLSNFYAMTSFMKECMLPEHDDVDLCLYFDPDMLMHGNNTSILELATATFEDKPEFVVVSPPFGCLQGPPDQVKKDPLTGACRSHSAVVSSRHVIAQRQRLVARMPITLQPNTIGKTFWEVTMTAALGPTGRGQMSCGQEFFIVHPPSRFQPHQTMSLRELLKMLVPESTRCFAPGVCSAEEQLNLGTRELVRRFEAGMLVANKSTLYNKGCGCCADMMPSAEHVSAGLAFYEPRGEPQSDRLRSEANDASFEWVVRCTQ